MPLQTSPEAQGTPSTFGAEASNLLCCWWSSITGARRAGQKRQSRHVPRQLVELHQPLINDYINMIIYLILIRPYETLIGCGTLGVAHFDVHDCMRCMPRLRRRRRRTSRFCHGGSRAVCNWAYLILKGPTRSNGHQRTQPRATLHARGEGFAFPSDPFALRRGVRTSPKGTTASLCSLCWGEFARFKHTEALSNLSHPLLLSAIYASQTFTLSLCRDAGRFLTVAHWPRQLQLLKLWMSMRLRSTACRCNGMQ